MVFPSGNIQFPIVDPKSPPRLDSSGN